MKARAGIYLILYGAWLLALFAQTGGFADPRAWFTGWVFWDSFWYADIWYKGYAELPKAMAFPPGYSYVIGPLAGLTGASFHVTGLIFNTVTYFFALVIAVEVLARVALLKNPSVLFALALTVPSGYYIFPAYSDSLFMLILWSGLALAILYPHSTRARIAEFLLLLVAPWVRLTGYALASWVLLRRWSVLATFITLAAWLAFNSVVGGDPFHFVNVQQLFSMGEGTMLDGIIYTYGGLRNTPAPGHAWTGYLQFHVLPSIYLIALFATGLWFCRGTSPLIGITILAILVLSHNQAFWRSVIRYDLPLIVCMFVPLLAYVERKGMGKAGLAVSVLLGLFALAQIALQIFFANLFKTGEWAL